MWKFCCIVVALGVSVGAEARAELQLQAANIPADGLVMMRLELTGLLDVAGGMPACDAFDSRDGSPVPAQFVPNPNTPMAGILLLQLPSAEPRLLRVVPRCEKQAVTWRNSTVVNAAFTMRFAAERMAGLPSGIHFASGKRFENYAWNDRLYHRERGMFWLRYDREARAEIVSGGPVASVVRVAARYCAPDGTPCPSGAAAVYDWYVFRDKPLAYVNAFVTQQAPVPWDELHFLELNYPDDSFSRWAGGGPVGEGTFSGTNQGGELAPWAALIEGKDAIGMMGGNFRYYDGRGGYGTYLHSTWLSHWDGLETRLNTWLWIGTAEVPADAVKAATPARLQTVRVNVSDSGIETRMQACSNLDWVARARRFESQMRWADAAAALQGHLPEGWFPLMSGNFAMDIEASGGGIRIAGLSDRHTEREWLGGDLPLFRIELRDPSGEVATISADTGWNQAAIHGLEGGVDGAELTWSDPVDARLAGVHARAVVKADPDRRAWIWSLEAASGNDAWALASVLFPQLSVRDMGATTTAFFPQGPGALNPDPFGHPMTFHDKYPSGWCSMQFSAVYGDGGGLYCGMHDPFGSYKQIVVESFPDTRSIHLGFEHVVPDLGKPHNTFALSGEAVWQLFDGDWFDASMIYREWARGHAKWWPALAADGRADTPLWMRELCAWAQVGGGPADCVEKVKTFQRFLDVPIGFHWYCWHQNPFDNDYPHYFPAKDGVAEAVKSLQESNVYVMPYINGRLWDTRDKGGADFEFTTVALPAVTKDEKGKPYTETYGSKEADGSPVMLGVMCPSTPLWQATVKDTVLRLQNEVGTMGVYIDQIAAAAPVTCMDASHGHPLGGGHWWNEGYWKLLDGLRAEMAKDRMITTECNAEPFIRHLDGYLTWHWQYNHSVPAFPAIYGGTVQMFGRSYGAGSTKDLALRMKAAQQLTFGEQIGWADPSLVLESPSAGFFRKAVQLRWRYRSFFYAGEMARPPRLGGDIPAVRGDWQWSGECWVETPAILAGAWRLPSENRLVMFFANVSEQPVSASFTFDASTYGFDEKPVHVSVARERDGVAESFGLANHEQRNIAIEPASITAWEITP